MLTVNQNGIYCEQGNFYLDPWRPVDRAIISHAHADHARWGSKSYLAASPGINLLKERVGKEAPIEGVPYGKPLTINDVSVSFLPAGHILGSSQVVLEFKGERWIFTGDYRRDEGGDCLPFEPLKAHTLVTESTFALPVYRWPSAHAVTAQIVNWIEQCAAEGKVPVLFCYSLGKAQRILYLLKDKLAKAVGVHGAAAPFCAEYENQGIQLAGWQHVNWHKHSRDDFSLVLAPPSVDGSKWLKKFKRISRAFASGWMQVRGRRRRRAFDKGFVISDHCDWPGLLQTIAEVKPEQVLVTHGFKDTFARYLNENGQQAGLLQTSYGTEDEYAER